MKIATIIGLIVVIIVGFSLFTEIPKEVKQEAVRISFETPMIFLWMFLFLITAIILFWILIKVQIPAVLGGESGKEEAEENITKFKMFFRKFKFWSKDE